ncbi:hypothetical protein LEP3755_64040 (plasmid) [Leptolyngbya sp. NIES-3755]|nr:hypothetical protein LEP3755_64040 [Leptolyngbya sp. NIES-3755]
MYGLLTVIHYSTNRTMLLVTAKGMVCLKLPIPQLTKEVTWKAKDGD